MTRLWDRLSTDMKFFLLSLLAIPVCLAIAVLSGCSTFDAPPKVEVIAAPDPMDKPRTCAVLYDGIAWTLTVPVRTCQGWTPL